MKIQVTNALRERLPKEWQDQPARNQIFHSAHAALNITDAIATKRAELAASGDLSTDGINRRLKTFVESDLLPKMRDSRKWLAEAEAKATAQRQSAMPPKRDPGDLAGAMIGAEIRRWLMEMSFAQRIKVALADDTPPEILQAILEVPAVMIGIQGEDRRRMEQVLIERNQPGILAEIEVTAEAVTVAKTAEGLAYQSLYEASGLTAKQFEELWHKTTTPKPA